MTTAKRRTLLALSVRPGDRIWVDGESVEVKQRVQVRGSQPGPAGMEHYRKTLLLLGGARWLEFGADDRVAMDDGGQEGGLFE
jgi:hypothetical protein